MGKITKFSAYPGSFKNFPKTESNPDIFEARATEVLTKEIRYMQGQIDLLKERLA